MTKKSVVQAILLDFDGVIVESVDIKTEAFRELFSCYPDKVDEIVAHHLTHNAISRYVKFKYICEHILGRPYNQEIEAALDKEFSHIVFEKVVSCPYVEGAMDFIEYFSPLVPLYVVSASPEWELRIIMQRRGIDSFFDGVYGSPGKKIDHVQGIMKKYQYTPSEVIYVGDMPEDCEVARASGMRFVGRENTEPFSRTGIASFQDMKDVMRWIVQHFNPRV